MYYLIKEDFLLKKIDVVSNCLNNSHKLLILKNYCISRKCGNIFDVIKCVKFPDGYLMAGYTTREVIGCFTFSFYVPSDMPLSSLKLKNVGVAPPLIISPA